MSTTAIEETTVARTTTILQLAEAEIGDDCGDPPVDAEERTTEELLELVRVCGCLGGLLSNLTVNTMRIVRERIEEAGLLSAEE